MGKLDKQDNLREHSVNKRSNYSFLHINFLNFFLIDHVNMGGDLDFMISNTHTKILKYLYTLLANILNFHIYVYRPLYCAM